MFPNKVKPIIVNSHPRSGTHLCIDFLRRQYKECSIKKTLFKDTDDLYFSIEGLLDAKQNLKTVEEKGIRVLNSCQAPIIKYHCYSERLLKEKFPNWMAYLSDAKSIYVYRNLYSVLCSTYIYMQTFENPGKGVSMSEFIRQPFATSSNRVSFWVDEVNKQLDKKSNFTLSYEDIIKNTEVVLNQLDAYLEMSSIKRQPLLPPKTYNKWEIRWQRLFSKYPDNTAILASHENNTTLDVNKAFTAEDLKFIKDIAGPTLEKMG